ncbi:LuxR C-terminal-related transcriptional regulator [uncultured Nocardioides sp.]|uniref:LuxR C-terminal-related transcriptional regulator n=1 Tax=uncultured Nocardioides sp. TaxID=198441 RepID=UPI000C6030E6|nr:LuxR C-terminal-related transcriptional regulator [uncultured Nocardioides sp.]MAO79232.1 hypothetical protein [Nocardioides sp.]
MGTHGRAEELQRLTAHVLERRAVLVVGSPGTGRTHLLHHLSDQLDVAQVPHLLVRGSDGEAGIPLVAFAPLLARFQVDPGGDDQRSAIEVYTRLPPRVAASGLAVLVDDLPLLTRASQVLLAQLARAGAAVVATTHDLDTVPRAVLDDVGGPRGWLVEELGPLTDDAVLAMAADLLGDQLSAPSAASVLRHAGGNPFVVRELVANHGARPSTGPGGVELGPLRVTPRLADLVSRRLERLDAPAHTALELLSVTGPLPRTALDPQAVALLEQEGLLGHDDDAPPDAVGVADPLLPAVVVDGLDHDRRTQLLRSGAALLAGRPAWGDVEVRLLTRTGADVDPARLLEVAGRDLAQGRAAAALELLDRLPSDATLRPAARLLRGAALSSEEQLTAAETELVAALATDDERTRLAAGHELGLLLAVRAQRPADAVTRVQAVLDTLLDPTRRRLLAGDLVKWRLMAGLPVETVPGSPHAGETDHAAVVNGAVIGAMIASLDGSPAQARELVRTGTESLARTDTVPTYVGHLLRLSAYLADAFDGRLAAAEEVAHAHRRRAAQVADPSLGMWEYATAELALHAGRLTDAEVLVERAVRHLAWRDFTGLRPSATALRAAVLARRGDQDAAEALAASLPPEQVADVKVALHLARVRAQRYLVDGDPAGAGTELATVALQSIEQSHRHLGLLALDDAVLADPASAPDRSALLAEHVHPEAALGAVLLRRTRAIARGDAVELAEVASELERVGLPGRAAACLGTARELFERAGRGEAERRAHLRQLTVLADHEAVSWPPRNRPALLSPRELEVARLAAARLRSREIAERCGLSVRTVDNHLARVYRKLGVGGRDDLPDALAALGGSVVGHVVAAGVEGPPAAPEDPVTGPRSEPSPDPQREEPRGPVAAE